MEYQNPPKPVKSDRVSKGTFRSVRIPVNRALLESSKALAWSNAGRQRRARRTKGL
jgi:hypothetical protein